MTDHELHEAVPTEAASAPVAERILFALRQAALLAVALLIAGLITERARPFEVLDRGLASTAFLWAIVVWLAVLLFNAIAFEQSQIRTIEATPLYGALAIGAFVFAAGLVSIDGSFGRRLIYALGNSLGAVMFWWGVLSLGALIIRRISTDRESA